jgi:hypothetical protein
VGAGVVVGIALHDAIQAKLSEMEGNRNKQFAMKKEMLDVLKKHSLLLESIHV